MAVRSSLQPNRAKPALADFRALICQVLKECRSYRLVKIPAIPLVKFLYLSECEYYYRYRQRLTSLGWFCYKYGPWARELAYADGGSVEVLEKAVTPERCVKYWRLDALCLPSADAIESLEARSVVRQVVKPWAQRFAAEESDWELATRELLDHVYHHTAPMRHARFGEPLDFDSIPSAQPSFTVELPRERVAELRRQLRAIWKTPSCSEPLYPLPELAPSVREHVTEALARLEDEEATLTSDLPRVRFPPQGETSTLGDE